MSWCARCKTFHKLYALCPEESLSDGNFRFGMFKFDPPIFNLAPRDTPQVYVPPPAASGGEPASTNEPGADSR
jgi:hypothetical protein